MDPYQARLEKCLSVGINIVDVYGRCVGSHAYTRTLVLLRSRDLADVVGRAAGSQRAVIHHVFVTHRHGTTCPFPAGHPVRFAPASRNTRMHLCGGGHKPITPP